MMLSLNEHGGFEYTLWMCSSYYFLLSVSTLAWRIPGMAEPGGLPSVGLHRVGHD